jgi:histidine triad (HIT) family protein
MNDCIFCKIIKNEIPGHKVYEDKYTLAFLDIAPTSPGHVLVVTKDHVERFEELDEVLLDAIMNTVQKIAKVMKQAVGCPAYNLIVNNGEEAGQIIHHFHIHIVPRKAGDDLEAFPAGKYESGEAEEIAKKIKAALV